MKSFKHSSQQEMKKKETQEKNTNQSYRLIQVVAFWAKQLTS